MYVHNWSLHEELVIGVETYRLRTRIRRCLLLDLNLRNRILRNDLIHLKIDYFLVGAF